MFPKSSVGVWEVGRGGQRGRGDGASPSLQGRALGWGCPRGGRSGLLQPGCIGTVRLGG